MNRHIVYPGQIPLDTDLLNAIQDAFYSDGWLALSTIGLGTAVVGLAVTPTVPASLQVDVAPGAIYSLQTVDTSAYGSLGTDSNQIVKQGLAKSSSTLTITPPATTGQSQNYLVQVAFAETDTGAIVLPYYNAADPSVAWQGPAGSGTAQNTVRQDNCVIALKPGAPAATGSQTTPSPDPGYTGIYVVTVANGQTTITSASISKVATAPYFPTLPQIPVAVQSGTWVFAVAGGSANAITATLTPAPSSYSNVGQIILVPVATNTAGAVTLNVNGLGNIPVSVGGNANIPAGTFVANIPIAITIVSGVAYVRSGAANYLGSTVFNTVGTSTYTSSPNCTFRVIEGCGAGGGGGGSNTVSAGSCSAGGGGSSGAWGRKLIAGPLAPQTVVIGAAGQGGALGSSGTPGGSTTFGSLITLPGGPAGTVGLITSVPAVSSSSFLGTSPSGVDYGSGGGATYAGFNLQYSAIGGAGGSGPYGTGGTAAGQNAGSSSNPSNLAGANALGYGAGGGGACSINTTGVAGGNGSPGLLIVHEYGII
ncbi:hypothetical protein [Rhizobium sp. 60-20]|uniref:glycine-rich domain-containing protein n=1 Tax=Rhizobium sp. 60-20 TaxID=1895819 RepID=UPI000926D45C|nr:hypothetical protein [Rhizobium sp. 60-20]OJY66457.1 MAG: hypothetical protein BGP09_31525 [Rhizobium sp. 60-20]